jgi:hypothetical protein
MSYVSSHIDIALQIGSLLSHIHRTHIELLFAVLFGSLAVLVYFLPTPSLYFYSHFALSLILSQTIFSLLHTLIASFPTAVQDGSSLIEPATNGFSLSDHIQLFTPSLALCSLSLILSDTLYAFWLCGRSRIRSRIFSAHSLALFLLALCSLFHSLAHAILSFAHTYRLLSNSRARHWQ